MNLDTHNKYFKNIAYNRNTSVSWKTYSKNLYNKENSKSVYDDVRKDRYEYRVAKLIESCHHVTKLQEIDLMENEGRKYKPFMNIINVFK
jgi:hypothetical protein